jgi:hypothetical protein
MPQSFISKTRLRERRLAVIELRYVAEPLGTTVVAVVRQLA